MKKLKDIVKEGINTPRKSNFVGKKAYSWDEINTALMGKGFSPKQIADILSQLNKASKK